MAKEHINLKIIITEYCNFDCKYCFYSNKNNSERIQMKYKDLVNFLQVIESRFAIDSITITGGEPLLYPEINEAILFFRSLSENIVLLTNGSLISNENIDLINVCVSQIDISLDDLYGAGNSYRSHVEETYKMLDNLRKKLDGNTKIGIAMSISKWNFDNITSMKDYCIKNGFNFSVNLLQDIDNSCSEMIEFSELDKQKILNAIKECGFSNTRFKLFELTLRNKVKIIPCKQKRDNMVIFPDGDISFCYNKIDVFGNIYTDNIEAILSKYCKTQNNNKDCCFYRNNCFALY